jgi:hypothetical protein
MKHCLRATAALAGGLKLEFLIHTIKFFNFNNDNSAPTLRSKTNYTINDNTNHSSFATVGVDEPHGPFFAG